MKKAVFSIALCFALGVVAIGQVPTVTNFDLDKYRNQRLAAEREYRENYRRMGFPSPEELDRQRDADLAARVDISTKLRAARLEEERLALETRRVEMEEFRTAAEIDAMQQPVQTETYNYGNPGYGGYYGGGYGVYGYPGGYGNPGYGRYGYPGGVLGYPGRYGRYGNYGNYGLGGYRVTPGGVYPTGRQRPIYRPGPFWGPGR